MSTFLSLTLAFVVLFFSVARAELPAFKKNPVVYGISPYYLSRGYPIKGLVAVRKRLPEIAKLGVNIVWLQPITPPFEAGHGYDVMNFKEVWNELGSKEDLKKLVEEAHQLGIRIMLDVVLNHSSSEHPFILDIEAKGKASPYYSFYMHEPKAGVPYAQHFHRAKVGTEDFIYYFWPHLYNFNYDSVALRNYINEVLTYWVKEYNIDGYRFDASWAPSSRWPEFYKSISATLRRLKPDIILMAEDQVGYPAAYQGTNHPHLKGSDFDWAYDWNNQDPDWISKWSFQLDEEQQESIFNLDNPKAAKREFLRSLKYGNGEAGVKTLRYLENNDTPGFRRFHNLEQTVWATKIHFVLPGVPLVFYGQETGNRHELYDLPSFDPQRSLSSRNPELWKLHQKLIHLRRASEALSQGTLENLRSVSDTRLSFERIYESQRVHVELDFKNLEVRLDNKLL